MSPTQQNQIPTFDFKNFAEDQLWKFEDDILDEFNQHQVVVIRNFENSEKLKQIDFYHYLKDVYNFDENLVRKNFNVENGKNNTSLDCDKIFSSKSNSNLENENNFYASCIIQGKNEEEFDKILKSVDFENDESKSFELKLPEFLQDDYKIAPNMWCFFGKNNKKLLQGKEEHVDAVSNDATFHLQLAGEKIWKIRADPNYDWMKNHEIDFKKVCGRGKHLEIELSVGDFILINTKAWFHSTKIKSSESDNFWSISFARDVFNKETLEKNEDDENAEVLQLDSQWATVNLEENDMVFEEEPLFSIQSLFNRGSLPCCVKCNRPVGSYAHQCAILNGKKLSELNQVNIEKVGLPKLVNYEHFEELSTMFEGKFGGFYFDEENYEFWCGCQSEDKCDQSEDNNNEIENENSPKTKVTKKRKLNSIQDVKQQLYKNNINTKYGIRTGLDNNLKFKNYNCKTTAMRLGVGNYEYLMMGEKVVEMICASSNLANHHKKMKMSDGVDENTNSNTNLIKNKWLDKIKDCELFENVADIVLGNGVVLELQICEENVNNNKKSSKNDNIETKIYKSLGLKFNREKITEIVKNSPADKSGLKVDDIVQTIANQQVSMRTQETRPENLLQDVLDEAIVSYNLDKKMCVNNPCLPVRVGTMRSNVAEFKIDIVLKEFYDNFIAPARVFSFEEFSKLLTFLKQNSIKLGGGYEKLIPNPLTIYLHEAVNQSKKIQNMIRKSSGFDDIECALKNLKMTQNENGMDLDSDDEFYIPDTIKKEPFEKIADLSTSILPTFEGCAFYEKINQIPIVGVKTKDGRLYEKANCCLRFNGPTLACGVVATCNVESGEQLVLEDYNFEEVDEEEKEIILGDENEEMMSETEENDVANVGHDCDDTDCDECPDDKMPSISTTASSETNTKTTSKKTTIFKAPKNLKKVPPPREEEIESDKTVFSGKNIKKDFFEKKKGMSKKVVGKKVEKKVKKTVSKKNDKKAVDCKKKVSKVKKGVASKKSPNAKKVAKNSRAKNKVTKNEKKLPKKTPLKTKKTNVKKVVKKNSKAVGKKVKGKGKK